MFFFHSLSNLKKQNSVTLNSIKTTMTNFDHVVHVHVCIQNFSII